MKSDFVKSLTMMPLRRMLSRNSKSSMSPVQVESSSIKSSSAKINLEATEEIGRCREKSKDRNEGKGTLLTAECKSDAKDLVELFDKTFKAEFDEETIPSKDQPYASENYPENDEVVGLDDKYLELHSFIKNNQEVFNSVSYQSLNMEEKFKILERTFIFEQTNLIERCQREKQELLDLTNQERISLKRSFESEKTELLREIERQKSMVAKLSESLKTKRKQSIERNNEHQFDRRMYQLFEEKLKALIQRVDNFLKDSTENGQILHLLQSISMECNQLLSVSLDYKSRNRKISECEQNGDIEHCNDNSPGANKTKLSRTPSRQESIEIEESELQQEINRAYKRQKSELIQLFADEKRELEHKLDSDKIEFEAETRREYETRMLIERKAWQETIQDYEREVAILKYEREQMDRNYCIEMDNLKTEFEKEKLELHRQYIRIHKEMRRKLSGQLSFAIDEDNKKISENDVSE